MKKSVMFLVFACFCLIIFSKELLRISKNDFYAVQGKFKELDVAGRYGSDFIDIVVDESQKQMIELMMVKYSLVKRSDSKAVYPTLIQVNDSIDKLHLLYPHLEL